MISSSCEDMRLDAGRSFAASLYGDIAVNRSCQTCSRVCLLWNITIRPVSLES